jgi:hypothetical protein
MYPSQRGIGDCLWLEASMHLEVTSQGQQILVTSFLAWEDPEDNRHRMATLFDIRNFHLRFGVSRLAVRFQIAS